MGGTRNRAPVNFIFQLVRLPAASSPLPLWCARVWSGWDGHYSVSVSGLALFQRIDTREGDQYQQAKNKQKKKSRGGGKMLPKDQMYLVTKVGHVAEF